MINPHLNFAKWKTLTSHAHAATRIPSLSIRDTASLALAQARKNYVLAPEIQSVFISKNVNNKDEKGYTPLIFAVANDWPDAVQVLIQHGADLHATGGHLRWTALMFAAFFGQTRTTRILLQSGARVDARDTEGHTPLAIAASRGNVAAARALLDAHANTEIAGKDSLTPLMWAVRKDGTWQMAQLLVWYGAKIEARDAWGRTALMHASIHDRTAIRVLVRYGANLYAQDNNGDTALHHAARAGSTGAVTALIYAMAAKGSRILKNSKGENAAEVAERSGHHALSLMIKRFWKTGQLPTNAPSKEEQEDFNPTEWLGG